MPNLEALMKRGSWADIRTTLPWKSPIIWTSIATGKREKLHGIHDFVVRDPKENSVVPVSIASRKVKSIWEILTEKGMRVDVVNWYGSWPAEPLNGTMLSDRFMLADLDQRIFPKERTAEIDNFVTAQETAGLKRDESIVAEVGLYLLKKDQPDLHLVYTRDIDHMHHFFWRYYAAKNKSFLSKLFYGETPQADIDDKGTRFEDAYKKLDDNLGRILQTVGPNTVVIVVSDHGGGIKCPGQIYFDLNPLLEKLGQLWFMPKKKKIDFSKTVLSDMTKRPWYENREVFINLLPEGPNKSMPGQEQEKLFKDFTQRLKSLKTTSGKMVFDEIKFVGAGEDPAHLVARVNVKMDEKDTIEGEGAGLQVSEIMKRRALTGNHRMHGIFVMAGPGIRSGFRLRAASVLDMTPTMLYLLGQPVANDMQGRVLLEAMTPALKQNKPLKWIPTYETGAKRNVEVPQKSEEDDEMLEKLRSLGYIQ